MDRGRYLKAATGPAAGLFGWLATIKAVMAAVDVLNEWGLALIGLALVLGVAVRAACWSGVALLALYYLAQPPLFVPYNGPNEGSYLLVNKNLVELCALVALALLPTPRLPWRRWLRRGEAREIGPISRRQWIAELAGLPVLGAFVVAVLQKRGWSSFDAAHAPGPAAQPAEAIAGATRGLQISRVSDVKGVIPRGTLCGMPLSRLIMGGNLMIGYAHARDLLYVNTLVKAYHTRDKICETMYLGERCGLNAIVCNPILADVMAEYRRRGGRVHFITNCGGEKRDEMLQLIRKSVDNGALSCYIHGGVADRAVKAGRVDQIADYLEAIRKHNVPAGIGAHRLDTVRACVDAGLRPDYWVKTLHTVDYWSARPDDPKDNNWCDDPNGTIAYMRERPEPWIAFKVMAAGAIHPKVAFRYAFESGADFICAGMYDFQVVDDVNLALAALRGPLVRPREWRA